MRTLVQASKAAQILTSNPRLFSKMAAARISARRRMPQLPAKKQMNGIWFEFDSIHATPAMYFGSYGLALVDLMQRFLLPGSTFLDVGANIGYLSAVGAGLVGKTGQVHSFEPIPAYFRRVQRLAELNPEYTIVANPVAAGETEGTAQAEVSTEPGENTLVPNFTSEAAVKERLQVSVVRLDNYIAAKKVSKVALIKIDTEGYEFPVLLGLERFLESAAQLPAILCEIDPRAFAALGHKASDLTAYMARFGYEARQVVNPSRAMDIANLTHVDDVLLLPPSNRSAVAG
jgi:FkbM family methyltransferase